MCAFGAIPVIMVWRIAVWRRIHKDKTVGTLPAGEAARDSPPP